MNNKTRLLIKGFFFALPIVGIIVFACNKGRDTGNPAMPDGNPVTLVQNDTLDNGLVLPAGSVLSIAPEKPHTVHVDFRANYRFIGQTTESAAITMQSIDITCTCVEGKPGCSPFANSKVTGCASSGDCNTCKKTVSATVGDQDVELGYGAVLDMNKGIQFIPSTAELTKTPPAFEAMFSDSVIAQALRQFAGRYQRDSLDVLRTPATGRRLPAGYRRVPVSIFGRSALLPLQRDLVLGSGKIAESTDAPTTAAFTQAMDSDHFSCSCGSPSGAGCKGNSFWWFGIGTTYFCNGTVCISCTLHVPD